MQNIYDNLKEYLRFVVGGIIILLLIIISFFYTTNINKKHEKKVQNQIKQENLKIENENIDNKNYFKVDIKGQVLTPGVYELEENSRIIDLINKAGGLKEDANTNYINLSKKITDEMVVIIYSNDEINKFRNTKKIETYDLIESNNKCPNKVNNGCINNDSETIVLNEDIETKIVNINTADVSQLTNLPSIGESKALKIIEYRNSFGKFKTIDDLKNISGIGDSIIEKIKNYITF